MNQHHHTNNASIIHIFKKVCLTVSFSGGLFVHCCHYREDRVIQRAWAEGAGAQLSTGLHWPGAERYQRAQLRPRGKLKITFLCG